MVLADTGYRLAPANAWGRWQLGHLVNTNQATLTCLALLIMLHTA